MIAWLGKSAMITSLVAVILFVATSQIDKTFALSPPVSSGATTFAPGIAKSTESDQQSANSIAPGAGESVIQGRLPGGGCFASINSPGHLFRQEPTTDVP